MTQIGFEFGLVNHTGYRSQFIKDQTIMLSKNLIPIIILIALLATLVLACFYYEMIVGAVDVFVFKRLPAG